MSSSAEMGVIHPEPSLLGSPSRFLYNLKKNRSWIYNFIRRDVRIKYRNSILGYIWTILQPLLLAGVYYFVFTIIADQTEELYPTWVLIGVITWQFFGRSLNGSITSISRNSGMIKQIYFPREIFAITTVGSNLVITTMSLLVVIPFIFYYDLTFWNPLFMVNCRTRDFSNTRTWAWFNVSSFKRSSWRCSTFVSIYNKGWILSIPGNVDFKNDT